MLCMDRTISPLPTLLMPKCLDLHPLNKSLICINKHLGTRFFWNMNKERCWKQKAKIPQMRYVL